MGQFRDDLKYHHLQNKCDLKTYGDWDLLCSDLDEKYIDNV